MLWYRADRYGTPKDRGRPDHRFARPYEPIIESLPAYARRRDPRTFEQHEQFVRQHFGFGKRHRGAQLNGRAAAEKKDAFERCQRTSLTKS